MTMDILLTAVIPLLMLLAVFPGSRKDTEGAFFFGKEYTRTLKGLCAVVVMMVHVPEHLGNPLQDAMGSFAFVAVTCFFLVSAYGMHYSLTHKEDYLRHFWRNRLSSLLVPQLLVNVFFCIVYGVLFLLDGPLDAPGASVLMHLDVYVLLLLLYCVLFYILALLFGNAGKKGRFIRDLLLVVVVTASSLAAYFMSSGNDSFQLNMWPYERMGLVWGLLLFAFFPLVCDFFKRGRLTKILTAALLCLLCGFLYLKFKHVFFWGEYMIKLLLGVLLVSFLFLLSQGQVFSNALSRFLGDISYEMYLLHPVMFFILASVLPSMRSGLFILLSFACTILFAYLIHIVAARFTALLRSDKKCQLKNSTAPS